GGWGVGWVVGGCVGGGGAGVGLAADPGGKPRLEPAGPLLFSLSHSENLALIAVSGEREVGIDVERVDPGRDLIALARTGLDPEDAQAVSQAPAERRPEVFYAAWTRREAGAKCFGGGLTGAHPSDPVETCEIAAGPGWAAALALRGPDRLPPVRCFDL